VIEGPDSVRDYIIALHSRMVESQGRKSVVGEDFVYLEGDCTTMQSSGGRIN
jgi:hypothetical protein